MSRLGATCDRSLCHRSSHATAPHRRRPDHARLASGPKPCPAPRRCRRLQPAQGTFSRPVRQAAMVRAILGRRPLDGAIAGACDSTRSAQRRPSREIGAATPTTDRLFERRPHTHAIGGSPTLDRTRRHRTGQSTPAPRRHSDRASSLFDLSRAAHRAPPYTRPTATAYPPTRPDARSETSPPHRPCARTAGDSRATLAVRMQLLL